MRILCTTYDTEVEKFGPVFDAPNDKFAIRMFEDAIKHSASMREHKDTLQLVKLGDWNEQEKQLIKPCYEVLMKGKKVKGEIDNILELPAEE